MPDHICIVAINLRSQDDRYARYQQDSAIKKIHFLSQLIQRLCAELTLKAPQSMWIVGWREYGVTGANTRTITSAEKAAFKQVMLKLTQRYRQLTIIAGTVASIKSFKNYLCKKRLRQIREFYASSAWISQLENNSEVGCEYEQHLKQVLSFQKMQLARINVLRNTAYVFQHQQIYRHDKCAPFAENIDLDNQIIPFTIWQPAKDKNRSAVFNLTHPISGKPVSIGVEICREHVFGVLKSMDADIDLHFLLSASMHIKTRMLAAPWTVHLDKYYSTKLVKNLNQPSNFMVDIHETHPLKRSQPILRGPIKILVPFEHRIICALNETITNLSDQPYKLTLKLIALRDEIIRIFAQERENIQWICQDLLQVMAETQNKINDFPQSYLKFFLFPKKPSVPTNMLDNLKHMVQVEAAQHPHRLDVYQTKLSPLKRKTVETEDPPAKRQKRLA